jgi:translation initiation factor 1
MSARRRGNDGVVWSTEPGWTPPRRERSRRSAPRDGPAGDGIVRVRREVKGRRGKTVTTIAGVPLAEPALRDLLAELKRACGSGGALKDGVLEIQGDHRERVVDELEVRGYRVKQAGG